MYRTNRSCRKEDVVKPSRLPTVSGPGPHSFRGLMGVSIITVPLQSGTRDGTRDDRGSVFGAFAQVQGIFSSKEPPSCPHVCKISCILQTLSGVR